MGYIQITTINADGVTTKDLSQLTDSERLDVELDLVLGATVKLLCTKCHAPIPSGQGRTTCQNH